ncbi:hypothetical protein SEPCBS119000_003931 [Sporothrix epigloea]|uniref:Uncharacterized protein n=1 Tax=Sporothrix epigloea TaxID=1892477 RepID=A0ABP0DS73_9PEZI
MSASPELPCNLTPSQLMQKVYEIIQIFQTLALLIREIRGLCVRSFFRWFFGILFYFTPQLNPFRLVDAYNAAAEFVRAKQDSEKSAETGSQQLDTAETNTMVSKEPKESEERSETPSKLPSKPFPELPNIYGYA